MAARGGRRESESAPQLLDWTTGKVLGLIEERTSEGRIRIRAPSGLALEYPEYRVLQMSEGTFLLLPSWLVSAAHTGERLRALADHLQHLEDLALHDEEHRRAYRDTARELAESLSNAEHAKNTLMREERRLVRRKRRIESELLTVLSRYYLGEISDEEFQKMRDRLQRENQLVRTEMDHVRRILDSINYALGVASRVGFPPERREEKEAAETEG